MKVTRFPGESISRKDVVLSIPYPSSMELYPVSKAMEAKRDGEIIHNAHEERWVAYNSSDAHP